VSDVTIAAEPRTEFGKGAARRLRRADKVPAVLYGHGSDPQHLALPGHPIMLALRNPNALITLSMPGNASQLALAKHVQRDPLKGHLVHIDFIQVRRGERVVVEVPVHVVGDAAPDTLVNVEYAQVAVEAEATHLPEYIEVSVEGMEPGTHVVASELQLPRGVNVALEEDTLIVGIQAAPTADQLEAELDEDLLAASESETAGEEVTAGEAAEEESTQE